MILVTGANGMVGSYIDWKEAIKTDKDTLDVTDLKHINVYRTIEFSAILNLAAETDLEFCEANPEQAFKVNTIGTYNMLQLAKERDVPFIQISTAGVFDGNKNTEYNEEDVANPINVYGSSKWCADMIVKTYPKHYILRSSWIMGGGRKKDHKFIAKVIKKLEAGEKDLYGIVDMYGNPTYARDLIDKVKIALRDKWPYGLYNCTNAGAASRCDVAQAIIEFLGYKVNLNQVLSDFFQKVDREHPCERSHNEMLNIEKLEKTGLYCMRHWKEALAEYLITEWAK